MRLSLIALLVAGAFAETVALEKRATAWPTRLFAPYCDVLLWPTFDTAASGAKTGAYYYHLAFVTANSAGEPAWGSSVGMDQNWYGEMLTKLRNAGGDAIISFGGAIGTDLALYWTDVNTIAAKYQQVITQYGLSRVDFDVEGHAAEDSASIDRRNKAIVILKRNNPGLHVSYTLAVFPGGLATSGLNIIKNAVSNGAKIDSNFK